MATSPMRQRGAALVEFAAVALVFFTLLFSLIEYGRMMFLWNAVQEVSRRAARAAAIANFSDAAAMQAVRENALLGGTSLPLAPSIGSANVRIDYLWMNGAGALQVLPALPACPMANRINCARDPQGASCIRFVRVRLCGASADASCPPLAFEPWAPISLVPTRLPTATTVTPAESLGYAPGQAPCP